MVTSLSLPFILTFLCISLNSVQFSTIFLASKNIPSCPWELTVGYQQIFLYPKLYPWVFVLPSCFKWNCVLLTTLPWRPHMFIYWFSAPSSSRRVIAKSWLPLHQKHQLLWGSCHQIPTTTLNSFLFLLSTNISRPPVFMSLQFFIIHQPLHVHTFLLGQPRFYNLLLSNVPSSLMSWEKAQHWTGEHCWKHTHKHNHDYWRHAKFKAPNF